jgi:ACS family hexuronate transporter-like MFS transporter
MSTMPSSDTRFLWLGAWLSLYHLPQDHPRISAAERAMILQGRSEKAKARFKYGELFHLPQVWGLLLARVFADPVWWFYLFWLPKYLQDVRHFSLAEIGMIAWLPYLMADLGSLTGGWLSGRFIAAAKPVLNARRWTMVPFAMLMPVGILVATLPSMAALGVISLVTFSHMAWKTNLMTMTNDIFPTAMVGSAAGVVGLGSGLAGAISMPLVGRIVDAFGYQAVFWAMGFLHPAAMVLVLSLVRQGSAIIVKPKGN